MVVAGAAVLGDRAHKLDDVARSIGLNPVRKPALSDEALIRTAQEDQSFLLSSTRAVSDRHPDLAKTLAPLIANIEAHVAALGGMASGPEADPLPASAIDSLDSVIEAHKKAAAGRTKESLEAVSGEFAQVLASIAVSLSQSIRVLQAARKNFE